MTGTLALLIRSLRTDVRLARSHLFRLLFVGLLYFALISAQSTSIWWGAPGLRLFSQVAWLNVLLITVAGASFFSTVITEEKEEQTLGLLRMAGISPLSLLLGKAIPRLVTAVLLLSLQLPFTLLAVTLGGVTVHQILAEYAALAAYLVLISQLGLFASVVCRRSRQATLVVFAVLFLFVVAPPYLAMILTGLATGATQPRWAEWTVDVLQRLSEASGFQRTSIIAATGFGEPIASTQVVTNLAAAAVLFALAWITFDWFNRAEALAGPERGLIRFGRTSRRGRAPRAWKNAFFWKDFHFLAGGTQMLLAKMIAYGVILTGLAWLIIALDKSQRGWPWYEIGSGVLLTMLLALLVELTVYASRVFNEEMKWRTLPLLMILPCRTASIAYSKLAGTLAGLIPAITLFVVGARISPEAFSDAWEGFVRSGTGHFLLAQFLFFVHLTALVSLSLRWGAAAVAFVAVYIVGWSCLILLLEGRSVTETEPFFLRLSTVAILACGVLQFVTLVRLRRVAAQ